MVTANFVTMIGLVFILTAFTAVFFSPYRHWLGFMLAGMLFGAVWKWYGSGCRTCSIYR